ncbi:MAG: THUMP-like domain-containing protein [Arachnia sp.]
MAFWDDALAAAEAEPDPTSLAAAERLRRTYPSEMAAAALSQVRLRRRAAGKHPHAARMLWTADGLEQATRHCVAGWRASRFREAGASRVWDLGSGIGVDAMALAEAGLAVTAVEIDPVVAEYAAANLQLSGGGEVRLARAEDVDIPAADAVFLDPARRTGAGRTWRVEDFSPSWGLVAELLASPRFVAAKLGPGMPKDLIPDGVRASWVSVAGQAVEVSLWNGLSAGPEAVVFASADAAPVALRLPPQPRQLPVRPLGRYLIEPDNAVIRAGVMSEIAPEADLWLLDSHVAYLSADEPIPGPLATNFEVLQTFPFDLKSLRTWVRENHIGALEIKKRAVDVDPARLRRQLKPSGKASATLILARTPGGTRVVVARRVEPAAHSWHSG